MEAKKWEKIKVTKIDDISKISMNDPKVANAQDDIMLLEMDEAFKSAGQDKSIKVIILTGEGPHFCGGHNIGPHAKPTLVDLKDDGMETWVGHERGIFYDLAVNVRKIEKPVIAAIHGLCITGGLMYAGMCDIIYASKDAKFQMPILRYASGADEILVEPWIFGPWMAKQMLWTGDPLTAEDAYRLGFVNKVFHTREELDKEVLNLAKRISLMPPVTVKLLKKSINYMMDRMGFMDALEYHFMVHQLAHLTDEAQEVFWKPLREAYKAGSTMSFFRQKNEPFDREDTHPTL